MVVEETTLKEHEDGARIEREELLRLLQDLQDHGDG